MRLQVAEGPSAVELDTSTVLLSLLMANSIQTPILASEATLPRRVKVLTGPS